MPKMLFVEFYLNKYKTITRTYLNEALQLSICQALIKEMEFFIHFN